MEVSVQPKALVTRSHRTDALYSSNGHKAEQIPVIAWTWCGRTPVAVGDRSPFVLDVP